ncbi:MAG TPA: hypothetical protein VEQ62_02235 [Stellaceae bacterium]|nr:hypothetical protein [Stellaceae bacterium]
MVRAETALFHWRLHVLKTNRLAEQARSFEESLLDRFSFTTITDKTSHTEAMEARARAEYERDRDEVLIGCVLDADAKEGDGPARTPSSDKQPYSF